MKPPAVGGEDTTNRVLLRGARDNLVKVEVNRNIGDIKRLKIGGKVGIRSVRVLFLDFSLVFGMGLGR